MRLLHLSDIHFREPACSVPATDPEVAYRTRLKNDLLELCRDAKKVDAILVGGDIASKGHKDEYAAAEQWLLDLAKTTQCPVDSILVVPGNHDVDRSICNNSQAVSNAQEAIARASSEHREKVLRAQLNDVDTGQALFRPLENYNEFAAKFACNVYPAQPCWAKDMVLANGVTLRVHGLTSTLLSGLGTRDNAPGLLYVSPLQTAMNPDPSVVNLVICHHPPQWLLDNDMVEDTLNSRAAIQMFGHKHKQRCTRDADYIRFSAGAVNPERNEADWKPGYNLIDLEVKGSGVHRTLEVKAYVRQLQNAPEIFVPVKTSKQEDVWIHSLGLPTSEHPFDQPQVEVKDPAPMTPLGTGVTSPEGGLPVTADDDIDRDKEPLLDNLVYRFWRLASSQKREIATKLNLVSEFELTLPEPERYSRALKSATQSGHLGEVARLVERFESSDN